VSEALLLDNSAWSRLADSRLSDERAEEIAGAAQRGELVVSLPFLLEAGYSARDAADHAAIHDELLALPRAPIDPTVERLAIDAQGQLARAGHHRLPPVDLLMAAIADRHGLGVLHYDRDYDAIRERADLEFASVWLAEPGSL
jgi:predicted nucleic acid-binding protein